MVSSVLRLASLFCIAAVVVSFAAFTSDEAGKGSQKTVAEIETTGPTLAAATPARASINQASPRPSVERRREQEHGTMREYVDDVNDVLTAPFTGIVGSDSLWAHRVVQGLLAFAVFGLGLGFLSRYAATRGV